MFQKIKNFFKKIESPFFLIITLVLFLVIGCKLLVQFKDFQLFSNSLLNLIVLIIFYSAIFSFLIILYYKLFKFTLMKPSISFEEFKKLRRKVSKIAQELKKGREDKTISYNSKKFKNKWDELKKIEKIIDKKSISFKNWLSFFIFSIYFGSWEGLFTWSIKNSTKYFWKAVKDLFSLNRVGTGFRWYKLKDGTYIIDSFIYFCRNPVK